MEWDRYDSPQALETINELYENELSLFMNLFQPSVKRLRTVRTGSRKRRIYDEPRTPLDRALASGDLDDKRALQLKTFRQELDPFCLSERPLQAFLPTFIENLDQSVLAERVDRSRGHTTFLEPVRIACDFIPFAQVAIEVDMLCNGWRRGGPRMPRCSESE